MVYSWKVIFNHLSNSSPYQKTAGKQEWENSFLGSLVEFYGFQEILLKSFFSRVFTELKAFCSFSYYQWPRPTALEITIRLRDLLTQSADTYFLKVNVLRLEMLPTLRILLMTLEQWHLSFCTLKANKRKSEYQIPIHKSRLIR